MLVVKIELHSAITGVVSEIGRMTIANDGLGTRDRGNYTASVKRRGSYTTLREGKVENYPRLSYNVWRLVLRSLRACFPEEK